MHGCAAAVFSPSITLGMMRGHSLDRAYDHIKSSGTLSITTSKKYRLVGPTCLKYGGENTELCSRFLWLHLQYYCIIMHCDIF